MSAVELGKAVDKVLIATEENAQDAAEKERSERKLHVECEPLTPGVAEVKPESKETIASALKN